MNCVHSTNRPATHLRQLLDDMKSKFEQRLRSETTIRSGTWEITWHRSNTCSSIIVVQYKLYHMIDMNGFESDVKRGKKNDSHGHNENQLQILVLKRLPSHKWCIHIITKLLNENTLESVEFHIHSLNNSFGPFVSVNVSSWLWFTRARVTTPKEFPCDPTYRLRNSFFLLSFTE